MFGIDRFSTISEWNASFVLYTPCHHHDGKNRQADFQFFFFLVQYHAIHCLFINFPFQVSSELHFNLKLLDQNVSIICSDTAVSLRSLSQPKSGWLWVWIKLGCFLFFVHNSFCQVNHLNKWKNPSMCMWSKMSIIWLV